MSRWSRKSDEEKAQTAKNLKDNKIKFRTKHEIASEEDNKTKFEILKNGKLPLRCKKCGPTSSHHYNLVMMNTPFGGPFMTALGRCIRCNDNVKGIVDPKIIGLEMTMIVAQVVHILKESGNLTDERNEKVREWK